MENRLHWSFDEKCEALTELVFPECMLEAFEEIDNKEFSCESNWTNAYEIVYIRKFPYTSKIQKNRVYYGELQISKEKTNNNAKLSIRQQINTPSLDCMITEFTMEVLGDEISSLKPEAIWYHKNIVYNNMRNKIDKYSTTEQWGKVTNNGSIELSADNVNFNSFRVHNGNNLLTSNWGIMDAVQRLNMNKMREEKEEIRFDMIHNLGAYKGNQCIKYMGKFNLKYEGRELNLHGYSHIGEGILPSYYWVTDNNRLFMARFGLIAYILKSNSHLNSSL